MKLRVTFHALRSVGECEGMKPHTPKWAPTWGVGLLMDSQIFKEQLQGSKLIRSKISLYHWKALGTCMTHLGSWNISYGQKKGRESNCQFDFRSLKVWNRPDFLACNWRATYRWKDLDKGYTFSLDLTSIVDLHIKL